MAVYKHPENEHWYFRFQYEGQQYNRCVKTAESKKDAEQAERAFLIKLDRGNNPDINKGKQTFEEMEEAYTEYAKNNKRSWKNERWIINRFLVFFGGKKLKDITPLTIENYRTKRKNECKKDGTPLKNATLNREREILCKMFNIAINNGWIDVNPCDSKKVKPLREDNTIERYLEKDEEVRLLNACIGAYDYMRSIIIFGIHTGCRKAEILKLKWECVNLKDKYITLLDTKSGKKRVVPISPTLFKELQLLEKNKKSEYVFANPESGMPYYDIKRPYKALLKVANIENLRFHDLRHTNGTRLVSCGASLADVKDMMGHADLKTTSRYAHPVPEQQMKAMEALAKYNELLDQPSKDQ